MNIVDWRRREDLQVRLDEAMKEPWMVDMVSVLVNLGLPDGTQVAGLEINALRNAYNEGYFKCLANLERLRNWKEHETKPMPQPWRKKETEQ